MFDNSELTPEERSRRRQKAFTIQFIVGFFLPALWLVNVCTFGRDYLKGSTGRITKLYMWQIVLFSGFCLVCGIWLSVLWFGNPPIRAGYWIVSGQPDDRRII
eukprot:TRINITY_DN3024_c2_g1_i1.p2 TRINITY_DN3024_c2_g1~~TRINITY_DN3024_c2_g1_i1.p2  ORF type:complete len:103 (-),score=11.64 TRINITY_DN3024_c2_g1_i1:625-933(-)